MTGLIQRFSEILFNVVKSSGDPKVAAYIAHIIKAEVLISLVEARSCSY